MGVTADRCRSLVTAFLCAVLIGGCSGREDKDPAPLQVPRGFVSTLDIEVADHVVRFGPFVGYYFRPTDPQDLSRLAFVCFNEDAFYTQDVPANTLLFSGDARRVTLPKGPLPKPEPGERMKPVFSEDIPAAWLQTRPKPRDEYVHFHSCYDANGAVKYGYWLRHVAETDFTYDMGGRVGRDSPLYHTVTAGVDKAFPRVVEFDKGPSR